MKRTIYYKRYLLIPVMLLLLGGLMGCRHDNLDMQQVNTNYRSAIDFIRNNYDLSLFYAAIQKAGMEKELAGPGPYTVLAPGNTAFNQMGILKPSDFDKMNADSLRYMLRYHILSRRLLLSDIPANGVDIRYATLAGPELYASRISESGYNESYFNGCKVSTPDVTLTNGELQVLDKAMKYTAGTVQEMLLQHPEYSTFVLALKKFGQWDQLATPGPWTVFAPANAVLEAQGLDAATIAGMDTSAYIGARLFGAYILHNRHYFLSDLKVFYYINDDNYTTLQIPGDTYLVEMTWSSIYPSGESQYEIKTIVDKATGMPVQTVNIVRKALMDYLSDNGLVHDIPGVLASPDQAKK